MTCTICGNEFIRKRHTTGLYCGRRCAWLARGGSEFNAAIARNSAAARGDAMRGQGEGKSYRKINGKHEHRIVAEQTLGRTLQRTEVVHHIDGNKRNNSPENLAVISQRQHMIEHGLGLPGVRPAHEPWKERKRK